MTETGRLCGFLADLDYEQLSAQVVGKAKRLILDYLGYAMVAVNEPTAQVLSKFITKYNGGAKESTVLGYGTKTSCLNAALMNGAMGHMCEMDDTHRQTGSHPGDSTIASALALAERERATGREFLTAVVTGYEAALRVGAGVCPDHYLKGWHTSGTICTFGAAAAAGKILGFEAEQMENALGLVGVQAAGMFGSAPSEKREVTFMTKDLRPGKAAYTGVLSAILTEMGLTCNPGILEGEKGFCALYSDKYDLGKITDGMGERFKIMEVAHKPYSACRFIHPAIDATLQLMDKYNITKDIVKRVTVESYRYVAIGMDNMNPVGTYGPRFSIQFQLALTLAEGRAGLTRIIADENYGPERLKTSEIKALMQKVRTVYNEALDKEWNEQCLYSSTVKIETEDGKEYVQYVKYPKGEPENDLTKDELEQKFKTLSTRVLAERKTNKIIETLNTLEKIKDVRKLVSLLVP
jgi:2-methylcitrate dehydratase PrpD